MPAQPDESAAESIRNALQVLQNVRMDLPNHPKPTRVAFFADFEAIRARLEAALSKIEAMERFDPRPLVDALAIIAAADVIGVSNRARFALARAAEIHKEI